MSPYSSCFPCLLPGTRLTAVLKSSKLSGHFLLRDSQDPLIVSSCPKYEPLVHTIKKKLLASGCMILRKPFLKSCKFSVET